LIGILEPFADTLVRLAGFDKLFPRADQPQASQRATPTQRNVEHPATFEKGISKIDLTFIK
jgi:hypothetical protein